MYGKPESRRKRKRNLKRDYEQIKRYLNERDPESWSDSALSSYFLCFPMKISELIFKGLFEPFS